MSTNMRLMKDTKKMAPGLAIRTTRRVAKLLVAALLAAAAMAAATLPRADASDVPVYSSCWPGDQTG